MHPQALRMRTKLRKAGFAFSEISVHTIRYTTKADRAENGDFGRAVPLFKCPLDRQLALIPAMLESGLTINVFKENNIAFFLTVFDAYDKKGSYEEIEVNPIEQGEMDVTRN